METQEGPNSVSRLDDPRTRGLAVAPCGLGFFSMCVFWWFPFSLIIGTTGIVVALVALALGVRGRGGENLALLGLILSVIGVTMTLLIGRVVNVVMWDRFYF
ncbi:MAG TPA: hypothetical protein VIL46_04615 [Gemmataceae bacterium]